MSIIARFVTNIEKYRLVVFCSWEEIRTRVSMLSFVAFFLILHLVTFFMFFCVV